MIVRPKVEAYAAAMSTQEPDFLAQVATRTHNSLDDDYMMVGALEAELLAILILATGAQRVLEIGTYTGYSAIAMASAAPTVQVVTCELDPANAAQARGNIAASPVADRIELIEGDALQTLRERTDTFDLIFLDGAKSVYCACLDVALLRLAPHGLLVADNTLHLGKVIDENPDDPEVAGIREFNERVRSDPGLRQVILTVRQGVSLIMRA